jgi:mono/diheme cytochrome c family protein
MAATDQTYRNLKKVHVVFGVSCVLMLFSVIWMFVQDYNREYKTVQRQFANVEQARNLRVMLDQLPTGDDLEERINDAAKARKEYAQAQESLSEKAKALSGKREAADTNYRTIKGYYDSEASLYSIAVDDAGKETSPGRKQAAEEHLKRLKTALDKRSDELAKAKAELDAADLKLKQEVMDKLAEPKKKMEDAEDALKKMTASFDRFAKAAVQKGWTVGNSFRALPIIDGFESPYKAKQIVLNDLTIDYSFKQVPRYDRCTTCHLGIDRGMFDKASLTALTQPAGTLTDSLRKARRLLIERVNKGEDLGFDPRLLPTKVESINLTKGDITQYAAHPRLDLFVDSNSPHPMEKFGCTICHNGQGSATAFVLAAHTPADTRQTLEWKKSHDWEYQHDWEYPMHSSRFTESSCLQCHHQVTDLIRQGDKEEAPKLLRGYNLVKENGCFGCHEISGLKSGREVGPDLRTEPSPPLDWLSAADQDKAKADPLNPPGTLRKVGPSLRRLSEKTNEEWTRKWIQAPRAFREDTKMPHFYGLSNNTRDVLPDDQKKFPDAEIHAVAHYLFAESKASLKGDDTWRNYLIDTIEKHQKALDKGPIGDKDKKELLEAYRNFANLALLSNPLRHDEINRVAADQRRVLDRLMDLRQREQDLKRQDPPDELPAAEKAEAADAGKRLAELLDGKKADSLVSLARPVPIKDRIIDSDNHTVDAAVLKGGDAKHGEELFTKRGCLACHSHDKAPVQGDATFGPNLSRIRAKLGKGKGADDPDARRWLVQWLLNPNVYHPRTRMPVTFLKPADANDVAEWLLKQPAEGYTESDPTDPDTETLVDMARMYLSKAPGMTMADVNAFLPKGGKKDDLPPGIFDKERKKFISGDADEVKLFSDEGKKVSRDQLLWYVGKKSIGRLGCYGCHDLPGFEMAKPIGTALNDWGKKDPARLAFENADAFVHHHFNIVEERNDPKDPSKPDPKWRPEEVKENGKERLKPPFEEYFANEVEHQHRNGFLQLKLAEPRSYDYKRERAWDDRLRMPQFQFSRPHRMAAKTDKESDAEFMARKMDYDSHKTFEEALAREAVMTFVLGLVAEPIAGKYVYNPKPDRSAEVAGRQVIDKYNCAGCHQLRPGIYEFKPSRDALDRLDEWYKTAAKTAATDNVFPAHNAWVGTQSPYPERMWVYAVGAKPASKPRRDNPDVSENLLGLSLTQAVKFTNNDGLVRNIPAASYVEIPQRAMLNQTDPWGGTFTDMLVGGKDDNGIWKSYLAADPRFAGNPDKARATMPPPLIREGERVQTKWLYQFLLNPTPIRPEDHMTLRMPRFNMSPEESQALVNYFAGGAKLDNPGIGLTYPYETVPQREKRYWGDMSRQYVERLEKGKALEERMKPLEAIWLDEMKAEQAQLEAAVADLKKAEKKDEAKAVEDRIADLKKLIDKKDTAALRDQWKANEAYANDAYRLLTEKELCLKCHSIGSRKVSGAIGPPLDLAAERLRPDWVQHWLGQPRRMFPYDSGMPQPFERGNPKYQEYFLGDSYQQGVAVRDVLMDLSRIDALPVNRRYPPPK